MSDFERFIIVVCLRFEYFPYNKNLIALFRVTALLIFLFLPFFMVYMTVRVDLILLKGLCVILRLHHLNFLYNNPVHNTESIIVYYETENGNIT